MPLCSALAPSRASSVKFIPFERRVFPASVRGHRTERRSVLGYPVAWCKTYAGLSTTALACPSLAKAHHTMELLCTRQIVVSERTIDVM